MFITPLHAENFTLLVYSSFGACGPSSLIQILRFKWATNLEARDCHDKTLILGGVSVFKYTVLLNPQKQNLNLVREASSVLGLKQPQGFIE